MTEYLFVKMKSFLFNLRHCRKIQTVGYESANSNRVRPIICLYVKSPRKRDGTSNLKGAAALFRQKIEVDRYFQSV